ncbi:hypothetical protein WAF17_16360 [Bernardetia sp. ABR2-2B]|uniref:hypothetical protein n=1 Tax=Bernardetia sp. ABR2-2B TaxID=3127472 RepID=UPI0030D226C8
MYFELAQLDRAFYDYLRRRLVENGYLPDIATLSESNYKTQMQSMASSQKVIEIFGVGSIKARGRVDVNKVVIDRIDISPADIGAYNTKYYKKTSETTYEKRVRPSMTYNVTYQIGYVTDDTIEDRKLMDLILSTFGAMGCKNGINPDFSKTENYFHYRQVDFKDNSDGDYFEKIFRYSVQNVFIYQDTIEDTNICVLKDIDIDTINE